MFKDSGLVAALVGSLVRALPAGIVKAGLDSFIDKIEDLVAKSPNKFDDAVVIPLLKALRAQLSIEETAGGLYEDKPAPAASVEVNVNVNKDGGVS